MDWQIKQLYPLIIFRGEITMIHFFYFVIAVSEIFFYNWKNILPGSRNFGVFWTFIV